MGKVYHRHYSNTREKGKVIQSRSSAWPHKLSDIVRACDRIEDLLLLLKSRPVVVQLLLLDQNNFTEVAGLLNENARDSEDEGDQNGAHCERNESLGREGELRLDVLGKPD